MCVSACLHIRLGVREGTKFHLYISAENTTVICVFCGNISNSYSICSASAAAVAGRLELTSP